MDELQGVLNPQLQGILSGAFAGMQASGPSRMPTSLGQIMGTTGQAGLGAYTSALNNQRQYEQSKALIEMEKQKTGLLATQVAQAQYQLALKNWALGGMQGPPPSIGGVGSTPGALSGAMGATPMSGVLSGPTAGAPPTSPAGPMSGLPPWRQQVAQYGIAGLPEIGKQIEEQNKPVIIPQVGAVQQRPDGSYVALPGLDTAMTSWEQAKRDVANRNELMTVDMPDGTKQQMTRAQALALASGGQPAPQMPSPMPAPMLPQAPMAAPAPTNVLGALPPDQQSLIKADMAKNGITSANAVMQTPSGIVRGPVNQMPGFNTGKSAAQQAKDAEDARTSTVIGEGMGKRFNEIQDAGFKANSTITNMSRLAGLLEGLDTGKLTAQGFEIAAYAKQLGIPISEKLDNAQAAAAVANSMALELRNPSGGAGMPGAMSDADREFLTRMVAGLGRTPGANKLIIEGAAKIAERDKQVAQLARDYKRKNNGQFDDGFYDELRQFSEKNPLFPKVEAAAPTKNIVDVLPKTGVKKGTQARDTVTGKVLTFDGMTWK